MAHDTDCLNRECNGTDTCTVQVLTGNPCDDGDDCTHSETCNASAQCINGITIDCDALDTFCLNQECNGTSTCSEIPRNIGQSCNDGDPETDNDACQSNGVCQGFTCPPTLAAVFSDNFNTSAGSSFTQGSNVGVGSSQWTAYTTTKHGVRINGGRFEITNEVSASNPDHGHGYGYVRTGGAGSDYDNSNYNPVLADNTGSEVVWSFNMFRNDPDGTDGGFSCSSTSSQNRITVGLAYVLGTNAANGLNSSTGTCSSSATGDGYAVIMGGDSGRVRLVRFQDGLRNGAITEIVQSGGFNPDTAFSVRVTYNAVNHQWRLEVRDDGSNFANPATGSYGFTGTGTDATYVNQALEFSGPYFQTGCTGNCNEVYTTLFDNVSVGVVCAP